MHTVLVRVSYYLDAAMENGVDGNINVEETVADLLEGKERSNYHILICVRVSNCVFSSNLRVE